MLSPEYRISKEESHEALKLWLDETGYNAMSQEERDTVDVLTDADKLGRWPVTVSEVEEFLERDNREYWLSRFGKLPPEKK
jgi:hypothetical protein